MNLVELTESIVKSIVLDEESVMVKEFESDDEKTIHIEVLVSEDDLGRVIGKNGRTANSIRTLVQASSSLKDNKYVKIDIDKF
ncbi:MAG: KH domain-containing protein [Bacilli bacterium]|nr:KH domain-containing protein [Bacilli bacterium]